MNPDLSLSASQMREIGYRAVDQLVEHLATLLNQNRWRKGNPAELLSTVSGPPPENGAPFEEPLEIVRMHARFFAYVPPSNFASVIAEALATGYNVFAGAWLSGSGAAALELETIRWLRELCGMPAGAEGLFVSGGTMANLTGLAVARQVKLGEHDANAIVYCSDQARWAMYRSLRIFGFSPTQVRVIRSDETFRLPVADPVRTIDDDRARGRRPFCIVATAGTTNSGAVDPLAALAHLSKSRGMWFHIDGAYGAAALICGRGLLLSGLGEGNSLFGPHKWLFSHLRQA